MTVKEIRESGEAKTLSAASGSSKRGKSMAFLIFERATFEGHSILRQKTGETFSLAGNRNGLLYRAWEKRGKPLNAGWRVTRDELIQLHFSLNPPRSDVRMIIDYDPSSKWRVALIDLIEIYAYTWDDKGAAGWTPLMLKFHDIAEQEYETPEQKVEMMKAIPYDSEGPDFVEFLYLKGDDGGWNWGRNGTTNAAFLHGDARDYFRQFF